MSEILARIRVHETAGIRRFLYPLTAYVTLAPDVDISRLRLESIQGDPIPVQLVPWHEGEHRLDFAVSLDPMQENTDFLLRAGGEAAVVPDPLHLTHQAGNKLQSVQKRFQVTLGPLAEICDVVYDKVPHLTEPEFRIDFPAGVRRPDREDKMFKRGLHTAEQTRADLNVDEVEIGGGHLSAWSRTKGVYNDGCPAEMTSEITACKSWVTLNYRLEQPKPGEIVYFYLPLGSNFAVRPTIRTTFDCGVDGIYGHANHFGAFLNWFAPAEVYDPIRWEIGRNHVYDDRLGNLSPIDYVGTTSEAEFQQQRWFHLVNGTQAVAVAITKMPLAWQSLTMDLRHNIRIKFTLAETITGPAEFGVCYHFLNDVPAIAAATNPQSILLPPVVEVLPV